MTAQDLKAFQLFKKGGKRVSFKKLNKAIGDVDIVLFGEAHDISICHWLELEVMKIMTEQGELAVGFEMFEADEQDNLDLLQSGAWDMEKFVLETDLWSNFTTDYQPILQWALDHNIHVFASNAPATLPRQVFRGGFEVLDQVAPDLLELLPKLPIPYDAQLPGYQAMLAMSHGDMNNENFPKAQALRDAAMGHHIARNVGKGRILHLNGSYHSDNYEGIGWYLNQYLAEPKVLTITTVTQSSIDQLDSEHKEKADFIICIPEQMNRTYTTSF